MLGLFRRATAGASVLLVAVAVGQAQPRSRAEYEADWNPDESAEVLGQDAGGLPSLLRPVGGYA
jgi:hypothetical protein